MKQSLQRSQGSAPAANSRCYITEKEESCSTPGPKPGSLGIIRSWENLYSGGESSESESGGSSEEKHASSAGESGIAGKKVTGLPRHEAFSPQASFCSALFSRSSYG